MHYRLQFSLRAEDSYSFALYGLLYTDLGKKHIRKERIKIAVVWVVWTIIALFYYKLGTTFYMTLALFLSLEVLWQLFLVKIITSKTKCNCIRRQKQAEKDGLTETVMEFYDDHLADLSGPTRTELAYASLKSLIVYKNTHLLLYTHVHTGFIIPRTAFADDAQVTAWIEFLQSRGVTVETVHK